MELYILRHGETDYNKNNIIQGRGIDSSLNETGLKQAAQFYETYAKTGFDAVCYSSLRRTYQTVAAFESLQIPFHTFKELDELDWGSQEGQPQDAVNREKFHAINYEWKKGNYAVKNEIGESPLDVNNRLEVFKNWLFQTRYQKVLICTHGRTMRILLCNLLQKELKEMNIFGHKNTSLYVLKKLIDQPFCELILHNSLDHVA